MNKNKSFWAFAFGAVLGGGTVYYLHTKQGKELTKKAKKNIKKMDKEARRVLHEQSDAITKKANDTIQSTKDWMNELTSTAKVKIANLTHSVDDLAEKTQTNFAKGMDNAKKALHDKMNPSEENHKAN